MILIAHRGNIKGSQPQQENHPDYISQAIKANFHAEIDVWFENNQYILGHDQPQYPVPLHFLYQAKLWCHAKNIATFHQLLSQNNLIHCFFHQTDDCTLTSQKWIWVFPGKEIISKRCVAVCPEKNIDKYDISLAGAICSDEVERYRLPLKPH